MPNLALFLSFLSSMKMNIALTIKTTMSITTIVAKTATKILLSLQLQSLSDSMVDAG